MGNQTSIHKHTPASGIYPHSLIATPLKTQNLAVKIRAIDIVSKQVSTKLWCLFCLNKQIPPQTQHRLSYTNIGWPLMLHCDLFWSVDVSLYKNGSIHIKGAVCRIDSPNSKYWRRFFFTQPLLLWLDAHTGCQIDDTNRNERTWRWMKVNMLCFPKYNWVNWQWAGFTSHNKHRHSGPECTFSKENNIAFQINNYDNLACFLNICKHLMVFLCFIRVSQNPKYSTFKCAMVFTKFIQRIL